jgi:hypothetical protein
LEGGKTEAGEDQRLIARLIPLAWSNRVLMTRLEEHNFEQSVAMLSLCHIVLDRWHGKWDI